GRKAVPREPSAASCSRRRRERRRVPRLAPRRSRPLSRSERLQKELEVVARAELPRLLPPPEDTTRLGAHEADLSLLHAEERPFAQAHHDLSGVHLEVL